jgi:shikimate dehydrogenase
MITKPTAATKLFALLGRPVGHSVSPPMQQAAIDALGIDAVYLAFDVGAGDEFARAVAGLAALGAAGANVTLPHKAAALATAHRATERARAIGAANTLRFVRGAGGAGAGGEDIGADVVVEADNTDAPGFVDLVRSEGGADVRGARYAQIGTGGAGRAMAFGMAEAGVASITLANRTRARADELAAALLAAWPALSVRVVELPRVAPEGGSRAQEESGAIAAIRSATIVANATSVGLRAGEESPLPAAAIASDALAVDSIYLPDTPFLRAARAAGARPLGGLGMLVHQGARSLAWWTGREPDRALMRRAAEAALAARLA